MSDIFCCFVETFASLNWRDNASVLNHVIKMANRDWFGFDFLWKPLVPRRMSSWKCCNERRIDLFVQPLLTGDWQWVGFAQNVGLTPRWMWHIRPCCTSKQSQRMEFSTEDQCSSLFQTHGPSPYLEYKYNKLPIGFQGLKNARERQRRERKVMRGRGRWALSVSSVRTLLTQFHK